MWLLLLRLAHSADQPLTWWAADDTQAEAISAALAATWPNAPITVTVAAAPPGAEGLLWSPGGLELRHGELLRRHDGAIDAYAAAAMARSWSRAIEAPASPEPEPEPVLSQDLPAQAEVAPEAGPAWILCAGPASRRPQTGPAFHFVGQVLTDHLIAGVEFDPAERVVLWAEDGSREGGLVVRRLGATVGVREEWALEDGWTLESALSVGTRSHLYAEIRTPNINAALFRATASARLRLWAPPSRGQRIRLGGGLMVSHDGLKWEQAYPNELYGQLRPLTVAAELGVLHP